MYAIITFGLCIIAFLGTMHVVYRIVVYSYLLKDPSFDGACGDCLPSLVQLVYQYILFPLTALISLENDVGPKWHGYIVLITVAIALLDGLMNIHKQWTNSQQQSDFEKKDEKRILPSVPLFSFRIINYSIPIIYLWYLSIFNLVRL